MFCGYRYVLPSYTVSTSLLLSLFIALSTRLWGWISNCNYFIHPIFWGKIVEYFTHHDGSLVLTIFLPDSTNSWGFLWIQDRVPDQTWVKNESDFSSPFFEASQGGEEWSQVKEGLVKPWPTLEWNQWLRPARPAACPAGYSHSNGKPVTGAKFVYIELVVFSTMFDITRVYTFTCSYVLLLGYTCCYLQ